MPLVVDTANFNNIFERVIYADCVVLPMSNNITILDDTTYVFIAGKPSIGILRGLHSAFSENEDYGKEILKPIVFFGGRR